jgi:5-methylcytosine-specific restriction endonuclease McrA
MRDRRAKEARLIDELERRKSSLRNLVEAILVLSESRPVGGGSRYNHPELAAEARRRYKRAHTLIDSRLHPERSTPHRKVRESRLKSDAAVRAFYREVKTAESMACDYCWRVIPPVERVVDHIIPLSKGGRHFRQNLCCACTSCNSLKSNLMPKEFLRLAVRRLLA